MSDNPQSPNDLEARIAAYIDGLLPPAESARLEVYLANTDPRLAEQIIGMLNDRHRLRTLPRPTAPVDLAARVMEQVERATLLNDTAHPDHHAPHRWWQSRAAIAAGLFLMIGGFSYFVAIAVIGGGGGLPMKIATVDNPKRESVASPALPASVPEIAAVPEARATGSARIAKSGESEIDRTAEGSVADKRQDRDLAVGGAGGSVAMKSGSAVLHVPGDKELERLEKTEEVVKEQLDRGRDVVQNGRVVASKLGYATVDSPLRALTNISSTISPSAPDPIVVTLVARDERDYARLRIALEELINQDTLTVHNQASLQQRYRNNLTNISRRNSSYNSTGDLNLNNQRQAGGGMKQSANGVLNTTGNANGNFEGNNNFTFWDPAQRDFGTVSDGNSVLASRAGNTTQASAVATTLAARKSDGTDAKNNTYAKDAATAPAGQARGAAAEQQLFDNNLNGRRQQALQNFNAGPLYRVALREEQLVQLANQFRVDSITCGRQSYVIATDAYDQLAMAKEQKITEDADKLEKSSALRGKVKNGKSPSEEPATATPAAPRVPAPAPATSPAIASGPHAGGDQSPIIRPQESQQQAAAAPQAAPQSTQSALQNQSASNAPGGLASKPSAFIECIITMEQPVARATTIPEAAQQLNR